MKFIFGTSITVEGQGKGGGYIANEDSLIADFLS